MTLELLETSLRLSWSPLGVPETSRASEFDAQSSFGEVFFDFELSTASFELWRCDFEHPEHLSEHLSSLITQHTKHPSHQAAK